MKKQSFNYKSFSGKLLNTLLTNSASLLNTWKNSCLSEIDKVESELTRLLTVTLNYYEDSVNPISQLENFKNIIQSIEIPPEAISKPEQFRVAWKSVLELLKTLPETAVAPIDKGFYEVSAGDNIFTKAQKSYAKLWFNKKVAQQNGVSPKDSGERKDEIYLSPIPIDLFLRVFILLPVQHDILHAWNSYNRVLSGLIHSLQEPFIEITLLSFSNEKNRYEVIYNREHITQIITELRNQVDAWYIKTEEQLYETINNRFLNADKNWVIASTPLCPFEKFNKNELDRLRLNYGKTFKGYRKVWKNHWKGEKADWLKQIDISKISWCAALSIQDLYLSIYDVLKRRILSRLEYTKQKLADQLIQYKNAKYSNPHDLLAMIASLREKIEIELLSSYIPETIDTFLDIKVAEYIKKYNDSLDQGLEQLKDEYAIFRKQDSVQLLPDSILDTVALKSLVKIEADTLISELDEIQTEINDSLINTSNDLSYIGEIVTYMEDTAQELVEHSTSDDFQDLLAQVNKTVNDGFEQAIVQTDNINRKIKQMMKGIEKKTLIGTDKFLKETKELRDNNKLIQIKLEYVHSQAKKKLISAWYDAEGYFKKHIVRIFGILKKYFLLTFGLLNRRYRKLSEIARLGVGDEDSAREISEYLKHTKDRLSQLPTVYRRLFRFDALTTDKLYIPRNSEKNLIEQSYNIWKRGGTGLVALVGERGSGRTSFINHIRRELFSHSKFIEFISDTNIYTEEELLHFLKTSLDKTTATTLEELEQAIIQEENRYVCIFENIQVLFFKTISGLEIMKRFVLFAMRTDCKLFWLVSSSYYTWKFLDKVIRISSLFGSVVYLKGMNSVEMTDLILRRHRISGLSLIFAPNESLKKTKKFRKIKSFDKRQEWLKELFFEQLKDLSSGNVSAAILYWQNNIRITDNKKMIATVVDKMDLSFLQSLPDKDFFAITVLIQHEMINITDFSKVLNLTIDESRIILTSLSNRGIVIEKNGNYELHFFLYRPMTRILYEKRLLH